MRLTVFFLARRRPISFMLIAPALLLQAAIMGWAHLHIEEGLGNLTYGFPA